MRRASGVGREIAVLREQAEAIKLERGCLDRDLKASKDALAVALAMIERRQAIVDLLKTEAAELVPRVKDLAAQNAALTRRLHDTQGALSRDLGQNPDALRVLKQMDQARTEIEQNLIDGSDR